MANRMTSKEGMWALFGFDTYYPSGGANDLIHVGCYEDCVNLMISESEDAKLYRENYQVVSLSSMGKAEEFTRRIFSDGSFGVTRDED